MFQSLASLRTWFILRLVPRDHNLDDVTQRLDPRRRPAEGGADLILNISYYTHPHGDAVSMQTFSPLTHSPL